MKSLVIIISLLSCMQLQAQVQNNYMTNDEIQSFLDSMIVHKNQFIGKTMGEIYQLFEQARIPIRHFSYGETSPWIDPEGKCFLESIGLYTETIEEMNKGKEYFDIRIYLNLSNIETDDIFMNMPSDTWSIWWNTFKQRTAEIHIKDIKYYRDIMPLHF